MLTNDSEPIYNVVINKKQNIFHQEWQLNIVSKHDNKESRTYTAGTESFRPLKGGTERKFENGLGVVVSIWGINGGARYSATVLTFLHNGVLEWRITLF